MLIHPTLDQLRQLGFAGMARAFEELAANPAAPNSITPNGLDCCSTANSPTGRTDRSKRACATLDCHTRPPSRMSTIAPHAAWIARRSRNWPSAAGSRSGRI